MDGLLAGLADLGFDNLEGVDIFAEEEKKINVKQEVKKEVHKIEEKDYIYDRNFECPVCDGHFMSKIVKTGKARLIGTDQDLRPRHDGIDVVKYDVILCPHCGYAALTRYFGNMSMGHVKLIRDGISSRVHLHEFHNEIYTYEEALERYKVCLANAVVKHAKASEKAYICLKSAWLLRGYADYLEDEGDFDIVKRENLKSQEKSYLQNALSGFVEARQKEPFPICGMDGPTMDYLLSVLAFHFGQYDVASKMLSNVLVSSMANNRIKDRARELKEHILQERHKKDSENV